MADLDDVDDMTHYMQATGRLSRENAELRQKLATAERERDEARATISDLEGLCVFYGGDRAISDLDDMRAARAKRQGG